MRDILLSIFIFGFVPVAVARPYIGLLVFAWIGYMNPHRFTWGFAYTLPFAAAIGIATIIGFLITSEKNKLPMNALMIVWILWIFWMNITTLFAFNPDQAAYEWERAMKIQLTSIMAISLMQSHRRLTLLIWVIALSVGMFGIKGGVFVAFTGGNYLVFGPPGTFFEGNNGLAVALLMVLPLFWYMRSHTENIWAKRATFVCMILIAVSIVGSYSRGAIVGLVAVAMYLFFKSRHRWKLVPIVIVFAFSALLFLPQKWFDRVDTIQSYEEDDSAMGRVNAWQFAYNLAVDRPMVGGGYGTYSPDLFRKYAPNPEDFHDAHSIYFEALGEHGFVGLILFLMLGWLGLRQGNRIRKICRDTKELAWAYDLASMVQVGLIGYAVSGAFVGLAYFDLYYHLLAIIVLTRILVDRQIENSPLSLSHLSQNAREIDPIPQDANLNFRSRMSE